MKYALYDDITTLLGPILRITSIIITTALALSTQVRTPTFTGIEEGIIRGIAVQVVTPLIIERSGSCRHGTMNTPPYPYTSPSFGMGRVVITTGNTTVVAVIFSMRMDVITIFPRVVNQLLDRDVATIP
jgi:hypothetical protein